MCTPTIWDVARAESGNPLEACRTGLLASTCAGVAILGIRAGQCFGKISARDIMWRAIPTEFETGGCYARHRHHHIYWRLLSDGAVGVVTILHERMHQLDRFREDRGA